MKQYRMVYLNKGMTLSRERDLEKAEMVLNDWVNDGWTLQQVVSPSDGIGAMIAVVYREI